MIGNNQSAFNVGLWKSRVSYGKQFTTQSVLNILRRPVAALAKS